MAAAQFYAAQFAPARVSFQAIAEDTSSSWHGIAAYLVARALVRDAFLSAPPNDSQPLAGFDSDQMKQAQQQLESIRSRHLTGISERAIQELLNLVRLRTEPQARLRELSAAVAGPNTDPYYQQDLGDLTWYLNAKLDGIHIRENTDDYNFHIDRPKDDYSPITAAQKQPGFNKAFNDVADLRALAPIIDWLKKRVCSALRGEQESIMKCEIVRVVEVFPEIENRFRALFVRGAYGKCSLDLCR